MGPKQLAAQEAAWAREEAAREAEEAFSEAAVLPPIEDPTVLKAKREVIREVGTRRDGARHANLVMKHARIPRGIRCRQRGGRHKVSSVEWPESDGSNCCSIDDFVSEFVGAFGYE